MGRMGRLGSGSHLVVEAERSPCLVHYLVWIGRSMSVLLVVMASSLA